MTKYLVSGGRVYTQKVNVLFSDLATAGLTNNAAVFSLPAYNSIIDVWAEIKTTFTGGSIATYTISVGYTSGTELMLANDVKTSAILLTSAGVKGTDLTTVGKTNVYSASSATSIRAYAVSTVDTLDNATTGSIDIYIAYRGI